MVKENRPSRKIQLSTLFFILSAVCFFTNASAQFERFKKYDVADGICYPYIYTINQDKNGFIWMGTGEGLCRFDGFTFQSFSDIDSLSNVVVNTSFVDGFGDVWFGYTNGLVMSWDGNKFTKYKLSDDINSAVTSINQTTKGEIFICTSNQGCYIISSDGKARNAGDNLNGMLISSAYFASDKLLLGTKQGLQIIPIEDNIVKADKAITPIELSIQNIQVIGKSNWDGIYFIGTEDDGLYLMNLKGTTPLFTKIGKGTELEFQNIQDVLTDSESNLWICTFYGGLIKLLDFTSQGSYSHLIGYTKQSGFSTNYIKSIFSDREKNMWIGTYGGGVELLTDKSFTYRSVADRLPDNNILSVASNDSIIWLGGESSILEMNVSNPGKNKLYTTKSNLPDDKITALFHNKEVTWIGTSSNGIYQLNTKNGSIKSFFKVGNTIGNSINNLKVYNDILYAATKDGIYTFDLVTGSEAHYNTENRLPHNDIESVFLDKDNRLLFATKSNGIFELDDKAEIKEYFTVGQYELEFNSIAQDTKGQMWVSTYGQGIFLLLPDTVINFTVKNGLKSNYCYSVSTSDSNYVWIGHRLGLSRINIHNFTTKIYDVGVGIVGDCNENAVARNKEGKLFFGTTDGLIIYDSEKGNKSLVSPKTNILRVLINDKEYDLTKPIVLPYSHYKLRIEFVGLNYNDPSAVKYQYFLEGYDLDWSEISDLRYVIYSRVDDGNFKFQVRSYGSDGQFDQTPVSITIKVKPPIWKQWWFIGLSVLFIIFTVIVIIKYRERQQKELQEYLEKSLDERTREVVEQKEEIEIKNRDITDSINYAQRIQNSILPPIKKLQQNFSGSFIFYQPRDIVSGDFYWFDKIGNDRVIIVCADSTGHGVPGAFMSMIGTTLIKDICLTSKDSSPKQILFDLDKQLANTLNQNIEEVKSNDGMDIMVCEINTSTNVLRYASAMRPMIIYKGGEQIYVKGSRSSIGGQYDNTKEEKDFEDDVVHLSKGDLIYMFSDGYPDQFGGSMGKKFKMIRMKNLLKDIHKKPMEEQYEYVKNTFNLWKEDYDQVDDVLFMGIKI
jgi:ligand-binding sensor domain-containing protein/serine phosphatase RsbU (regulator of sigma subunit)